jgi:hypothetical protein
MNAQRKTAEALIYKYFDAVDPSGANTEFYKNQFSSMSDEQFHKFCERRLPFRIQTTMFEREMNLDKAIRGLKVLNVPLLEDIELNELYKNKDGIPVSTNHKAFVVYIHTPKLKQFATKKSGYNSNIDVRNPKSGHIAGNSKGVESDRELESLTLQNLNYTIKETTRAKADDMSAKNQMYNQINTTGQVYLKDLQNDKTAQTARNTVDVYLIGSFIMSNLIEEDYMTPYTLANKKKRFDESNKK